MTHLAKSVHKAESKFDLGSLRFSKHHPYLFFMLSFIIVPLFMLTAVCVGTMIVALPMSWIMGWI